VAYPENVNRVWLALILAASVACAPTPAEDEASFLRDVQAFRAAKNDAFLQSDSPVPADKRAALLPLPYYPPSLTYRVPAVLRVAAKGDTIVMPTSTGQRRDMRHVGTLEFSLRGQTLSLGAFVEAGSTDLNRLFVPFTDLTSGSETYPAGRYLDLDLTRTGIYVIDFNRAYNPYCYYNPTYDCPYPPRANRLQVPVRAGEKVK
jgi:uncharacterized protein (DUF1684 family)